ncbi:MAG TPA: hypothetical protein DDZ76_12455 [Xanthomonadales bacterium]|nr:hypothetical protein [Xanthomonadales bacterium]
MKRSQLQVLTGSSLLVIAAVFLAAVVLSGLFLRGLRVDLTENRLYTLTDGTKAVIDKIEEPINLYFFFSEDAARDLPPLRNYAARVRELIEEMAARSNGKIRFEAINPQPFTESEDRATGFGLRSVPVGANGQSLFFGLAGTNSTDGQTIIPFFQPDKEGFLEYDLAKLISTLSDSKRPVVGLISTLEMGPGFDPALGQPRDAWVIDEELRQLFEIRRLRAPYTTIADDVDLLMVVHPKGLSDDALYVIDQFVLRGGRLLVFVDPHSEIDGPGPGSQFEAMGRERSSNLGKLFEAWGVRYDPGVVVLDSQLAVPVRPDPNQQPVRHPAILGLGEADMSQQDVVTSGMAAVNLTTAGRFDLADQAPVRMETLLQSTANAMLTGIENVQVMPDPSTLMEGFIATGQRYVLAARLHAERLPTAFPERSGEGHLAESTKDVNIILVGDTDMLADRLWVQVQGFFGQRMLNPFASNGDFVVNAVDNLVGSTDLIQVRTRAIAARAFDTVDAIKRRADDRFRIKERELQAELQETERRLNELQSNPGESGALSLSPEQQAELERFESQRLRIRGELREVRATLDADIEALGTRLKLINILLMPVLVSLFAAGFALWQVRRRKRAQRGEA